MNSLSFCLSEKVIISSSFLKDSLVRYNILLVGRFYFYFFSPLNISSHSLIASKISAKKPMGNIILLIPSIWWMTFFCCFQDSLFDFWLLGYNVSPCKLHWGFPSWMEFIEVLKVVYPHPSSNLGHFWPLFFFKWALCNFRSFFLRLL